MKKRSKRISSAPRGVNAAKRLKARRGIALFIAMFMVVAIGALALSAIYLTANATLISKSYEREDDLKYEAEAALAIGKAELNFNPAALPSTSYVALMKNKQLYAADGQPINGLSVNLYVGQTGNTSGQFGRFASLVSEARDQNGTGFVRRLELTQESFAKFAYWSNHETTPSGGAIYFGGTDAIWGPVWSNDTLNILSSGATFHDDVGTAAIINGKPYGTFSKGYEERQKPIALPALTTLSTLSALATAGGFNLTAPTTDSSTRMRIEFVAADMNADGDSIDANEGFFRVYTANAGQEDWLRANWLGSISAYPSFASTTMRNCGDWHATTVGGPLKFFPFAVHAHPGGTNTWFDTVTSADHVPSPNTLANRIAWSRSEGDSATLTTVKFTKLMQTHAKITCFLGGDPHLVAVARTTAAGAGHYPLASDVHKGGEDTTFTPVDQYGSWTLYSATPNGTIAGARPADAKYLFPIYRGFNTGTKGVIYVNGTVGVSGVVNGQLTLYTPNNITILDDLTYANNPGAGVCKDIIGLIAGTNVQVADNGLNTPQYDKVGTGSPASGYLLRSMDNDTPDLYLDAVIMTLGTSFYVQNYGGGPTDGGSCGGVTNGRNCLYLTGGLIQNNRGPVGTSAPTGYTKRYSYDRCAVVNPPPYFPTTGRFQDNRYYELDPVRFSVASFFKSLSPAP
ncbi:MAG: hypothetical protein ABI442_07320 [Gemmatimonadaceae bacterium]